MNVVHGITDLYINLAGEGGGSHKNTYEKPIRENRYFSVEEYEVFQII